MNEEKIVQNQDEQSPVDVATLVDNNVVGAVDNKIETFDMGDIEPIRKKKKKSSIWIIILFLGFIIMGFIGYRVYDHFSSHPTDIIKAVVNRMFSEFSDNLNMIEKETVDIDILQEPIKITGEFQFNDKSFLGLDKEKIKYEVGLDYSKKYATGFVGLLKNGATVGDATLYLKNDRKYIKSTTMFDSLYDIGEAKFNDSFDLSGLESLDLSELPSNEDIIEVVGGIKDAFLNSLDEESMSQKKDNLVIDGKTVGTDKITYKITKESLDEITHKFSEGLLKNDSLIQKISELSGEDESEIREALEKYKTESSVSDNLDGEFSIYTVGLDHKVVRAELIDGIDSLVITSYDEKLSILYDTNGTKISVTSIKDGDKSIIDIEINGFNIATITVKQFDDKGIDLDYKVTGSSAKMDGTIKFTFVKKSDKEVGGVINLGIAWDIAGEKNSYDVNLTYNIKSVVKLEDIDTSLALDDFSEADASKIANKMNELQDTAYFKYFGGNLLLDEGVHEEGNVLPSAF